MVIHAFAPLLYLLFDHFYDKILSCIKCFMFNLLMSPNCTDIKDLLKQTRINTESILYLVLCLYMVKLFAHHVKNHKSPHQSWLALVTACWCIIKLWNCLPSGHYMVFRERLNACALRLFDQGHGAAFIFVFLFYSHADGEISRGRDGELSKAQLAFCHGEIRA